MIDVFVSAIVSGAELGVRGGQREAGWGEGGGGEAQSSTNV